MTTRLDDDGPDFDPDDPLAVILRAGTEYLGPPVGRYEAVRRRASRRRLLRTSAGVGVGLACAVGVLVALPFRATVSDAPTSPTVPLAPPRVSGAPSSTPSTASTPSSSTVPESLQPSLAAPAEPSAPTPAPVSPTAAPAPVPTVDAP
ncbi:hypothetical protein ACH4TV_28715 [Streptomyces sp. NPDC020898]|uniref:hypothetical protein n=1 Tax=Streptomyces sp. NPDC020898 TaxID=3365101 RepID=UPI0037B2C904